MPEAPDLEVIQEVLNRRVRGLCVVSARVLRPTVLRTPSAEFATDVSGRCFKGFRRRGKFLQADLSDDRVLLVNPMLTGLFQLCAAKERVQKKTCVVLELEGGLDLRYLDERQMGMVWYMTPDQLDTIPRLLDQGPDVMEITLEEMTARLKPFRGEIKGVLTRGSLVSGIGNAYSDEILFAAGISPFRKVRTLSAGEHGAPPRGHGRRGPRGHRGAAGAHGGDASRQGPRLPEGAQQGQEALPVLRRRHQSAHGKRPHHELLPPLPAGDAREELARLALGRHGCRRLLDFLGVPQVVVRQRLQVVVQLIDQWNARGQVQIDDLVGASGRRGT